MEHPMNKDYLEGRRAGALLHLQDVTQQFQTYVSERSTRSHHSVLSTLKKAMADARAVVLSFEFLIKRCD